MSPTRTGLMLSTALLLGSVVPTEAGADAFRTTSVSQRTPPRTQTARLWQRTRATFSRVRTALTPGSRGVLTRAPATGGGSASVHGAATAASGATAPEPTETTPLTTAGLREMYGDYYAGRTGRSTNGENYHHDLLARAYAMPRDVSGGAEAGQSFHAEASVHLPFRQPFVQRITHSVSHGMALRVRGIAQRAYTLRFVMGGRAFAVPVPRGASAQDTAQRIATTIEQWGPGFANEANAGPVPRDCGSIEPVAVHATATGGGEVRIGLETRRVNCNG